LEAAVYSRNPFSCHPPRGEKVDSHRNEPMMGYSERECRLKKERCQEVFGGALPVAGRCLLNDRSSITGGPSPREKLLRISLLN